jgi:hypothetical protein
LVEILQSGGIVESGAIEGELQRIEDYLFAEPFEPFAIEKQSIAAVQRWRRGAAVRTDFPLFVHTQEQGRCVEKSIGEAYSVGRDLLSRR